MDNEKIMKAVRILRQPCAPEYQAIRREYAEQLELQVLVGPAEHDESAEWLAEIIIMAAAKNG